MTSHTFTSPHTFTSLRSITDFLNTQDQNRHDHYTLQRVELAMERLGHPEQAYQVVHVGGTSGKGSTCHMIQRILQTAGYKTGIYTSPALISPLERIQINRRPVTEKSFVTLVNKIWPQIHDLQLTYFEFFTVLALTYFADRGVDFAVVEVGLGGRLDATNVVQPAVAIVTDIGLDHKEMLGGTRKKIAKEKEAIIKPGCIGLTGSTYVQRGKYIRTDQAHVQKISAHGITFSYKQFPIITLRTSAVYQVTNAVLAIEAAQALHIPKHHILAGLAKFKLAGRFQQISKRPFIIVDGAHNPPKMQAFTNSLMQVIPNLKQRHVVALVAVKFNKDIKNTFKPLINLLDECIITTFEHGASPKQVQTILQSMKPKLKCTVRLDPAVAYSAFRKQLTPNSVGIITGSLYLIGDLEQAHLIP